MLSWLCELLFNRTERNPVDEEALKEWINDKDGQHRDEDFGGIECPVGQLRQATVLVLGHRRWINRDDKLLDIRLEWIELFTGHEDQTVQEFIPVIHDTEQRDGRQHRHGQRDVDLEQDVPWSRAVDKGGFIQLLGQVAEEVHREDNIEDECLRAADQDKCPDAVQHVELFDRQIQRDQTTVEQHRENENPHEHIAPLEFSSCPRERVRHEHNHDKIENNPEQHSLGRCPEGPEELIVIENLVICVEIEIDRP